MADIEHKIYSVFSHACHVTLYIVSVVDHTHFLLYLVR